MLDLRHEPHHGFHTEPRGVSPFEILRVTIRTHLGVRIQRVRGKAVSQRGARKKLWRPADPADGRRASGRAAPQAPVRNHDAPSRPIIPATRSRQTRRFRAIWRVCPQPRVVARGTSFRSARRRHGQPVWRAALLRCGTSKDRHAADSTPMPRGLVD